MSEELLFETRDAVGILTLYESSRLKSLSLALMVAPQAQASAYAKDIAGLNELAEDAQEGVGAFQEKRQPRWKGR